MITGILIFIILMIVVHLINGLLKFTEKGKETQKVILYQSTFLSQPIAIEESLGHTLRSALTHMEIEYTEQGVNEKGEMVFLANVPVSKLRRIPILMQVLKHQRLYEGLFPSPPK